ncbi:MAG: energy-coupling factor transporter transmembrane protein EcfT [Clostridiales Family XIII bacterium]|nr:energy-coupling factor transporter transmembrane protein EcfT [Clostridiales Family XIII bacterium]
MNFPPLLKLLIAIILSSLSIFSKNIFFQIGIIFIIFIIYLVGKIPISQSLKRAKYLFPFLIPIFIIQAFFYNGVYNFSDFGLPETFLHSAYLINFSSIHLINKLGLILSFILTSRLFICILLGLLLASSHISDYIRLFTKMKIPFAFSFMVLITFRFIPIFRDEIKITFSAMSSRGLFFKNNFFARIFAFRKLCIPIIFSANRRAKMLSDASEGRLIFSTEKRGVYKI